MKTIWNVERAQGRVVVIVESETYHQASGYICDLYFNGEAKSITHIGGDGRFGGAADEPYPVEEVDLTPIDPDFIAELNALARSTAQRVTN